MDGYAQPLPLPIADGNEASLEGRVKRMVFDSNDGSMRVFELAMDDGTVHTVRQWSNGSEFAPLKKNDQIKALGAMKTHPRFGRQFNARDVVKRTPTTAQGVAKVISGKAFKGIGPKVAQKLVDGLGQDLVSVLNRGDPGDLVTDMIGAKKAKILLTAWHKDQAANMTDSMLAELDIGALTRKKIRETIPDIETVIQTDPYRIAREVDGIGFKTADALAQKAGVFQPHAPARLSIGLSHALDLAGNDGHTGLSRAQLIDAACDVLTFGDRMAIGRILDREIESGTLVISPNDLIQTKWTAQREARLARSLVKLSRTKPFTNVSMSALMTRLAESKEKFNLTDEQHQAVAMACAESLSVVTGGPGTGKTTTIRALIWVLQTAAADCGATMRILAMAPTGKAADRMNESTDHPATTFHTGLGRNPDGGGGFFHNADEPFDCELVISDEWSMVDTRLGDSFVQAIKPGVTRLVMVGDVDQLASVDAGRVLYDVIQSGVCPVTRFTKVHRTGAGSAIAVGAAAINKGVMPEFGAPGESDLVFIDIRKIAGKDASPALIAELTSQRIVEMVSSRLPKFAGVPTSDIQVLSPGKNSLAGTTSLNVALQNALNPASPISMGPNGPFVSIAGGQKARMGDKVICTRNSKTADKDQEPVFNGDVGVVDDLEMGQDLEGNPANWLHLAIGSKKRLKLEREYWQNVALAYALTIHKSQGSEYPIVVIPMITSHYKMLKRNLLYTGVTRARKMCVIVGTRDAIATAIASMDGTTRQTGLLSRIKRFAKLD